MSGLPLLRRTGESRPQPGQLFERHASKDGRAVAILRATQRADGVLVECQVFPQGGADPVAPGPFRFATAQQASQFAQDTVEALTYLGCDASA